MDHFQIVGTKGNLRLENAFGYKDEKVLRLRVNEKTSEERFKIQDQFGPQLHYFADCILSDRKPEPAGEESLADLRILEAIFESLATDKTVAVSPVRITRRPTAAQRIDRPAISEPVYVKGSSRRKKAA